MAAYVIAQVKVTQRERYADYQKLAQQAVAKHGGRYIVRGGELVLLEGQWDPGRIAIVEFPTLEAARRFYDSPEYKIARDARAGAAQMTLLAVNGV